MDEIKVGLVGISGYGGMELARLLAAHPVMRLTHAWSRVENGKKLGDFYPFLRGLPGSEVTITAFDPETCAQGCDLVFLAVPAGTAMELTPILLDKGLKVVDFSADFRLQDPAVYAEWYKQEHACKNLLPRAVYGLPELYAAEISQASLVANPGCYPTSIILGLYAALKNHCVDTDSIVIDSKSGASGAGRKASVANLFCEISDNFRAYGLPRHRHTPEIEQELGRIAQTSMTVQFTPHLVPMSRGILSTIYTKLTGRATLEEIHKIFVETWAASPWVRVLPAGELPQTKSVRGSMFCDIGLVVDERTKRLIILSVIDNLCRGAAGQALANANLMFGLNVAMGMEHLCPLP